jgi:hypothetical protein
VARSLNLKSASTLLIGNQLFADFQETLFLRERAERVLGERYLFSNETLPEKSLKMHKNCIQKPNCLDMSQMTSCFGVSQMPGFVASKKDYRMVKTRTR